jgi:hypothetical protein
MSNHKVNLANLRKKISQTHELIYTSYHESGHIIYALLKLCKVDSSCVYENKQNKRIEGVTHYNILTLDKIQDQELFNHMLHSDICIRYSGLIAEKIHFKKTSGSDHLPMVLKDGSSSDTLYASDQIKQFDLAPAGKARHKYKQKLISSVANELDIYWDSVTVIAHNLFKHKRLNYESIKNALVKSSDKSFWKHQFKDIDYIFENAGLLDETKLKNIFQI